jgi:hypothetical protein
MLVAEFATSINTYEPPARRRFTAKKWQKRPKKRNARFFFFGGIFDWEKKGDAPFHFVVTDTTLLFGRRVLLD